MARVADVLQHLLQAEREQDDAGDHRQVPVAVGVAREPRARLALCATQHPLGDQRDHVEVGPPQAARHRQPQDGRGDHGPRDRFPGHALADRHDRLPQRDDDDQAVSLGEMRRGVQPPAGGAREQRAAEIHHDDRHPREGLRAAFELRRDQQQRRAPEHRGREPDQLSLQAGVEVRAGGEPEDREMQQPHGQVREREHHRTAQATVRVVDEGLRHTEGHHEHGGHAREHRDAAQPFVGPHHVAEPGVAHPAPPQERQHQQPAEHAAGCQVVRHQRRHLGDREHEHQIEEQLDLRDPVFLGHRLETWMVDVAHDPGIVSRPLIS